MLSPREQFTALRGHEPEFFLQKDSPKINLGGNVLIDIPKDHPWYEDVRQKTNSLIDEVLNTPHEVLSGEAWRDWQTSPSSLMTGPAHLKAAHVLAMEKDIRERSKPIPTSLWRGSTGSPEEEIQGRGFLSATSNKKVAQSFARSSRKEKGTGRVSEFKAGQAHGFPLSEVQGTRKVVVGSNQEPESEWIITKVGE